MSAEVTAKKGHRGYIASRPVLGERAAQHVQNLVIRDFCQRHGLKYLLSAAEYAMESCYLILEQVMTELPELDGIVCYSVFMLPQRAERRAVLWRRILESGKDIHFAVEGLSVRDWDDVSRVEDIWLVRAIMADAANPQSM